METIKQLLRRVGHIQAQVLLTLLFVFVVIPYGLLLRLLCGGFLPRGEWRPVEEKKPTLEQLRRSF